MFVTLRYIQNILETTTSRKSESFIFVQGVTMEPISRDLTLEQQFEMKRIRDAATNMSREQALELLMQASRLLMIKTNVVRNLAK